jgi:hypothetical protein
MGGAALAALLAAGGVARAQGLSLTLRGYATETPGFDSTTSAKLGFGVDAEVRPVPMFGFDLSLADTRVTQTFTVFGTPPDGVSEARDSVQMMPLLVGLYIHPLTVPRFDLYFGPVGGVAFFNDNFALRPVSNHETALGAVVGFDVGLAGGWSIGASGRYFHTHVPDGEAGGDDSANFVQVGVGLAYRW